MFSQVSLSLKSFQLQHCSFCCFPMCAVLQINTKYVVCPLKTCSDAMFEFEFVVWVCLFQKLFSRRSSQSRTKQTGQVLAHSHSEAVCLRCEKQTWRNHCCRSAFKTWLQNRQHDWKKAALNPSWSLSGFVSLLRPAPHYQAPFLWIIKHLPVLARGVVMLREVLWFQAPDHNSPQILLFAAT